MRKDKTVFDKYPEELKIWISTFGLQNKPRIILLLFDSARRYFNQHSPRAPLHNLWAGLGSKSRYNNSYYKVLHPHPGYSTWFKLTDRGVEVIRVLLEIGNAVDDWWPERKDLDNFLGKNFKRGE
jgi:hypothetical protein